LERAKTGDYSEGDCICNADKLGWSDDAADKTSKRPKAAELRRMTYGLLSRIVAAVRTRVVVLVFHFAGSRRVAAFCPILAFRQLASDDRGHATIGP
jgi:hypothetical protein